MDRPGGRSTVRQAAASLGLLPAAGAARAAADNSAAPAPSAWTGPAVARTATFTAHVPDARSSAAGARCPAAFGSGQKVVTPEERKAAADRQYEYVRERHAKRYARYQQDMAAVTQRQRELTRQIPRREISREEAQRRLDAIVAEQQALGAALNRDNERLNEEAKAAVPIPAPNVPLVVYVQHFAADPRATIFPLDGEVPAAAAAVLWAGTLVDAETATAALGTIAARAPLALLVNGAVAFASWRARAVSGSGVLGGLAVGLVIWLAGGAAAWGLLFACFLVAAVTSRLGLRRKRTLGIAQEAGGRRGAANALANCGLAAAAAIVGALGPHAALAAIAFTAALVSGAADTAASEVGKAFGRTTWSPLTFARVAPGEIGGLSGPGTLGGLVAATALGALAAALGLVPPAAVGIIVVASMAAMLAESVLGATLEPRGLVNNDLLNFLQTGVAAAVAVTLARMGGMR